MEHKICKIEKPELKNVVLFFTKEKFRKQKNWKTLISSATEDKFNNDKGKLLYIYDVKENNKMFLLKKRGKEIFCLEGKKNLNAGELKAVKWIQIC